MSTRTLTPSPGFRWFLCEHPFCVRRAYRVTHVTLPQTGQLIRVEHCADHRHWAQKGPAYHDMRAAEVES